MHYNSIETSTTKESTNCRSPSTADANTEITKPKVFRLGRTRDERLSTAQNMRW